ncbi:uncharacterized protein HKBW3S43_01089 [Candidatus Hakubella thermalkaliphila]|uniref:DUF1287 domain-containing protein n=2 Tax=Candidatus Hakubella thermalkaliphila TaxID=2754717 RepID=A0A6V8PSL9_9ACTN|nr:DUF1287 domain-containing protein [Candidatus Hakubella thermalkaliphila]GFP25020.1 uncharacterized protein HKBW3S25_00470 [Candidatus Hakubella thermalkaliphila]GFP27814.1 uncharacterized protein HKBW3S33_01224 [Candidatus Hakubella thermalkaliphila]GFP35297.1 uncharacterized protein HKBW3S43_01089 [Candidatus Hakubella thermalkaliphila]
MFQLSRRLVVNIILLLLLVLAVASYQTNFKLSPPRSQATPLVHLLPRIKVLSTDYLDITSDMDNDGINDQQDILEGARMEVRNRTRNILDMEDKTNYFSGGDPPPDRGVATDLIARALENAGFDIQKMVDADMRADLEAYPLDRWNQLAPDPNIDYRRAENLMVFFNRHAQVLTTYIDLKDPENLKQWAPGDIVFWDVNGDGEVDHAGILSDKANKEGLPMVIHNFPDPGYTAEEDVLRKWRVVGHYRFPGQSSSPQQVEQKEDTQSGQREETTP